MSSKWKDLLDRLITFLIVFCYGLLVANLTVSYLREERIWFAVYSLLLILLSWYIAGADKTPSPPDINTKIGFNTDKPSGTMGFKRLD